MAAAIQFQADYWSSLKNSPPAVFGQVRSALSASGLLAQHKVVSSLPPPLPSLTAFDALCAQLLTNISNSQEGGQQLVHALVCWFKEVVEQGPCSDRIPELEEVRLFAALILYF
jgi:hypothetical protein